MVFRTNETVSLGDGKLLTVVYKVLKEHRRRQKMKSRSFIIVIIIFLWIGSAADARYSGGTGEPNDPYRIATPEDLNDIGNHKEDWDKHFVLVNDVILAEYSGMNFKIIGKYFGWNDPNNKPFSGVFDGNEKAIWNFTWTYDSRNSIGLFGHLGSGGQIKNLALQNVDVNAMNSIYVGGLVGFNDGLTTKCYSTGSVSG